MKPTRLLVFGLACAVASAVAHAGFAFDAVTSSKKVEDSDWFRVGRVYAEAGEWGKAQAAFDRAFAMNTEDDTGMIEYGALANVNNDRETAEAFFEKAMKKNPREFWRWVNAGASYLGVRPQ